VGKSIYHVTPETRIKKEGKPAKLEDGVPGEPVSGYIKRGEDGTKTAATVNFNGKGDAAKPAKAASAKR
jgi:hypothetical protein